MSAMGHELPLDPPLGGVRFAFQSAHSWNRNPFCNPHAPIDFIKNIFQVA